MYDTNNINLEYNDILTKISEYDIYKTYFKDFQIGKLYRSPFRKDKNPSFAIYVGKRGNLMYKDHGTGECGNIISFVSKITGIKDFKQILHRISKDTNIDIRPKYHEIQHYEQPSESLIGVVRQEFTDIDIKYWQQFNISINTLKKFNVNSIKYYLCNGIVKFTYRDDCPMYSYKVYNHFKIYRPLANKKTKWRNNLTEYDIQGYKQLPKSGNILFITKSLKDVMALYELGYAAISVSSETTFIPDIVLKRILKRFNNVFILFDRDVTGVRETRLQSFKTGLNAIFINKKYHAKDISDAIKVNGFDCIKKWLDETTEKELERKSKKCDTNNY
jgi:hypothetical protein